MSAPGSPLVVVFLLIFQACNGTQPITDCIDNYNELKVSILNSSENAENLLKNFYPPNQSPAHVLNVYYYINGFEEIGNETHPKFENPNITADYIFQWVDSSTLLLTEFRLFRALSFSIAGLETGELSIKVPFPFCDDDRELELLNLATVWVKIIIIICLELFIMTSSLIIIIFYILFLAQNIHSS